MRKSGAILSLFVAFVTLLANAAGAAPPAWEWANPRPTGAELHGVAYGDGQFVTVGDGGAVLTSPDGVTWTERSSGTDLTLQSVAHGAGRFVAVGGDSIRSSRWVVLSSPNGVDWHQEASGADLMLYDVTFGGGRFLAVGARLAACGEAGGLVLTSADGSDWQEAARQGVPPLLSVAYGNGQYVAAGPCGPSIVTSADGAAWNTTVDVPSSIWIRRAVAYGNGLFVSISQHNLILQSTDGVNWIEHRPEEFAYRYVVAYAGDRFISALGSSPDGVTWTRPNTQALPQGFGLNDGAYGGGTYVAVGERLLATSSDGHTWTSHRSAVDAAWNDVVTAGGRFVAVGDGAVVAASADGRTWAKVYPTEPPNAVPWAGSTELEAVAYGGGVFVAVGYPRFLVLTSTDAVSWTWSLQWVDDGPPIREYLTAVTYGGGRFVAVGRSTGLRLTQSIASTDGVHWAHSALFSDVVLTAVASDGSQFLAVGTADEGRKGVVWRSPDGIQWTPVSADLPPLSDVAYAQGRFVAVGQVYEGEAARAYALSSPDGRTWEQVPLPGTLNGRLSVAGGYFVVPGSSALYVSKDGLHWGSMPAPKGLNRVVAAENQLIATGDSGSIFTLSYCQSFIDVAAGDPVCGALPGLQEREVIHGYPDGTFRPDAPVTRAETAKMLAVALEKAPAPAEALPFTDTEGHWAATRGYLQAAVALNAIQGYPDGTFRPDAPVTRAELIKMVTAASSLTPGSPSAYRDVTASDWFAAPVSAAVAAGLIGPDAPTPLWSRPMLQPNSQATRADTAILLANLLRRGGQ